jgi:hypothetical protein
MEGLGSGGRRTDAFSVNCVVSEARENLCYLTQIPDLNISCHLTERTDTSKSGEFVSPSASGDDDVLAVGLT